MKIADLDVLIVEDDDFQRGILVSLLQTLGIISISEAANGRQALEIIQKKDLHPINVAICDLNMPEMDGMELLRHLGQEYQNIAVILTSALNSKVLASVGRMTKLYGIKLLGVMEKPVLLASLESMLSKFNEVVIERLKPVTMSFPLEEIQQGIQADQFAPYFQPKVDLRTGQLVGAEALARWLHPEHGVVLPGAFIPHLERTGNMDELTFCILRKSAATCRSYHDRGQMLTIAVNLSLVSLDDTRLADRITSVVRESGIDPHYIILEITESAAMTNIAPALENLARLCMNGFVLSIDDFGTGSSNLQQLTRIAFNELKIDQSFVKDFSDNKALRIVVESSIDLARQLLVRSVAEGVESQQDWDALRTAGCDTAQGYFIAPPMDAQAFGEFAMNYKFQPAPILSTSVTQSGQEQIKVLVIEDDNFTRKIIIQVLRGLGFSNAMDVNSAESAIILLESHTFDLVITDIHMPEMNGLKFIQMVRGGKTYAKPETRIVVLTSFSQTEVIGTALALDVNGFLVKPIIPAVVDEKLRKAMTERFPLHAPIAYEAIRTDLKSLHSELPRTGGKVGIIFKESSNHSGQHKGLSLSLHRLRPGMVLKENVYLRDGTLLLSGGHALSELSINRLNDLKVLLPNNGVIVQETF